MLLGLMMDVLINIKSPFSRDVFRRLGRPMTWTGLERVPGDAKDLKGGRAAI
jgi:hypothetical protein